MTSLTRKRFPKPEENVQTLLRCRSVHSLNTKRLKRSVNFKKRRHIENDLSYWKSFQLASSENEIVKLMKSDDYDTQLRYVKKCREMISQKSIIPIDNFIKDGAHEVLVEILNVNTNSELLIEAAWALTNLSAGNVSQTSAVVKAGGIAALIKNMKSGNDDERWVLAEQCAWGLGNIAGDSSVYRNEIIRVNGIEVIIDLLTQAKHNSYNRELICNMSWLISNLCSTHSTMRNSLTTHYPTAAIKQILPIVMEMVVQMSSETVQSDLSWAVAYSCENNEELIELVVSNEEFLDQILSNLQVTETGLVAPALRLIGNIIASSRNTVTDLIVELDAIELVSNLMHSTNKVQLIKECLWVLSNSVAGKATHAERLMSCGVVLNVVEMLNTCHPICQREAIWMLYNFTASSELANQFYLINYNLFEHILPALSNCKDVELTEMLLEVIDRIFNSASKMDYLENVLTKFGQYSGAYIVQKFADNGHETAKNLMKQYLVEEDDHGEEVDVDRDLMTYGSYDEMCILK